MSTRRVNGKDGATVISAAFLTVISVGLVQAGQLRPLSQQLIVQAAIEGVLVAAGGFPDCNENGVDDAEDIADLTSPDCNGNGIPDECELADNDCNGDGRPDECGVFISCDSTETRKLTASDAAAFNFGASVSIHGDTAIIGSSGDHCADGIAGGCGSAYVFRFDGSNWTEEQRFTASDVMAGNVFGHSVSVSGNTALVGSLGAGNPGTAASGAVYVYRSEGSNWIEEQKLIASDAVTFDYFGGSISLDGDTAVIGAMFKNCAAGSDCGSAYVFRFDGTLWIEQKLTASDANAFNYFGGSVSISGDTVVVGAVRDDCAAGAICGAAYVFRFDGTSWIEKQKLTAADAAANDAFAGSLSIDGGRIVLGSSGDDCEAGGNCGSAYVFRFDGTNWIQTQKLTAYDATANDRFGTSVAVNGDTAAIGARFDDCAAGDDCGAVYIFRFDGTNWVDNQKLTASDANSEDQFGRNVSITGNTALVGAPFADCAAGTNCGAAYIFDLVGDDCNCNAAADLCESQPDCDSDGLFDSCEVDSDGDGIPDDCDICPTGDDAIDTDGDSVPDGCDVCPGSDDTLDSDGDTVPDDCDICDNNAPETCTFASPVLAPPPHDILKNRYISVDPLGADGINVGLTFDIRLELVSTLVNGVTVVGSQWWANVPDENCISVATRTQPETPPNWDACPTLHLTGCPIIPTSSYDIVAVVGGLASVPSLAAETQAKPGVKWWGDVSGFFDGIQWRPPNGIVSIEDAVAVIKTFQDPNAFNAAHVSVVDLHPNRPDLPPPMNQINKVINFDDVFSTILGFQGMEYPGPQIELCP